MILLWMGMCFPESEGSFSGFLLKNPAEVRNVGKSAMTADLRNGCTVFQKQIFGKDNPGFQDIIHDCGIHFQLKLPAEIGFADMQFGTNVINRKIFKNMIIDEIKGLTDISGEFNNALDGILLEIVK